ncbi:tyrosine-type recombinase/integrase [Paraburkholderia sp. RL17-373-BIF-A]|uniref:tyrosine-type recombinase/integrase n=1 Tax=Paraburkholderia sp. RL17-373-BIF-A TaxID=3031629 RepID=UPI0038BB7720
MKTALIAPRPLDVLELPADLDGRDGTNRARGHSQIAACDDLAAVRAWLARVADKKTTFENYRKEAERLLLWAIVQLGKPLSSLTHEDLQLFRQFLNDPQPHARWVADDGRKYPRHDPRWRPFYRTLGPSSQYQAMVIINALFAWLVEAGYLAGNPLSLSRQRARRSKPRITRYLDRELWQEVKLYIDSLPKDTPRERERYLRARWLFTLFYLGGLRISEVSGNTMGCFFCRRDADGHERWWLEVLGKGDKEGLVPASAEMMVELGRYRRERGLSALPSRHEDTPLVLPLGKSMKPLTRAALHTIGPKFSSVVRTRDISRSQIRRICSRAPNDRPVSRQTGSHRYPIEAFRSCRLRRKLSARQVHSHKNAASFATNRHLAMHRA